MGCDIHTFIEYSDFTDQDGQSYWSCMAGQYNPGRDYRMFGLLASVRGGDALFETRGMPEGKVSYQVQDYMRCRIADEGEGDDGEVSLATAQSWTTGHYGETITNDSQGKPRWVTNPDLHSHSWLTVEELRQVLDRYRLGDKADAINVPSEDRAVVMQAAAALHGGESYAAGWDAILAAMEAFKARGCQTRLVFCFDN